jgi:hypothetical protein
MKDKSRPQAQCIVVAVRCRRTTCRADSQNMVLYHWISDPRSIFRCQPRSPLSAVQNSSQAVHVATAALQSADGRHWLQGTAIDCSGQVPSLADPWNLGIPRRGT